MHDIETTRGFERDFLKIPQAIQQQITKHLTALSQNPYSGKRLHGPLKDHHSLRCGDYRVIYKINEKTKILTLEHCGHRKKIYEK